MGKLSQYMNQNTAKLKQVYVRYIGTILCAGVISILAVISESKNYYDMTLDSVMVVFAIWLAGNFFVESVWKPSVEYNRAIVCKRVIGYAVALVIAIGFKVISYLLEEEITDTWGIIALLFDSILCIYIVSMIGLAFYFLIREQGIGVPAYIGRAGFALLRALGVFFVLNIVAILILQIINSLLFEFDFWDMEEYVQILLAGFVYFPVCLMAVSDTSEDNSTFTKKFVSYVLMPCVWIAMLIIYLYVIKIFVKQEIPSNEIFSICQWLFLYGAPVWMMEYAFLEERDTKYKKLVMWTKYIYAPFILLEIYAIGVRIAAYGLTESRYGAVLFILAQMSYIFWEQFCRLFARLRKKPSEQEYGNGYEGIILVLLALCFIALLLPFGNAMYLSYTSQKNRLNRYLESDKVAAGEAYRYLKHNPYGEKYLDKTFTKDEIAELESAEYCEDPYGIDWNNVNIHANPLKEGMNIGPDYNTLYKAFLRLNAVRSFDDFSDVDIQIGDTGSIIEGVDLTDCVRYYAELDEKRESAKDYDQDEKEGIYEMQVDHDRKLIIYSISFSYTYGMKEIRYFDFDGYLLEK